MININIKKLRAALLFAAKGDMIASLNGVALSHGHIVATDRKAIIVIRDDSLGNQHPELVIPAFALEIFLADLKATKSREVTALLSYGDEYCELKAGSIFERYKTKPEYFQYIKWQDSIVPDDPTSDCKTSQSISQFNWTSLSRFERAAEILGSVEMPGHVLVFPRGKENARVEFTICQDAFGVAKPAVIGGV